jgi:hypothetical protein
MYSFAQRPDTFVVDEPLYGHYLSRINIDHPGREELLENLEKDGEKALKSLLKLGEGSHHIFIKNMAHHYFNLPYEYLLHFTNLFLIRDPKDMLLSLINQIPNPVMRDTGLRRQWELFNFLIECGQIPLVLDAKILLTDPEKILNIICEKAGITFNGRMLSWPQGPKEYDGIWAKYWYQSLHLTTGFMEYRSKEEDLPDRVRSLYQQCLVYYQRLYNFSLQLQEN